MANFQKLTPRSEDYSKWYNELVVKADLAEQSAVRGCMVIKPYGYAIWETIQAELDRRFKEKGVRNASQMCLDGFTAFFGLSALSLNDDILPQGDNASGWLKRLSDTLKTHPNDFEQIRKNYKLR